MYPTGCFNPTMRYGRLPQLSSRFVDFLGAHQSCHRIHRHPRGMNGRTQIGRFGEKWPLKPSPTWRFASPLFFWFEVWSRKFWIPGFYVCFFFQVGIRLRIDFFMASSLQPKCEAKPLEWWQVAPLIWGRAIGYFWLQLKGMPPLKLQGLKWICEKWCFFSSWTLLKIATIAACFRRHSE